MAAVKLPVYDRSGKKVGDQSVDPAELAPRINKQLLHDAVVMYQANLRQGTFGSKSRAAVRGTTKKMYRQKGTGHARAGSRRSGVRRGGGHIFAKKPRDFSYRMPRKAARLATRMAIASKILDEEIIVIDELAFSEPKTRDMAEVLAALKLAGETVVVATEGYDENVYKSGRNIEGVSISPAAELNALSVLAPKYLLVTKAALEGICQRAKGKQEAATA